MSDSKNVEKSDLKNFFKLLAVLAGRVTCTECCNYYVAPETAPCGHSLCHSCWKFLKACPKCAAPIEYKSLQPNLLLENETKCVLNLVEAAENSCNYYGDEYLYEDRESHKDLKETVKDWLLSSQNKFSAPVISSQLSMEGSILQINSECKKNYSSKKVMLVEQSDWDKIEILPDTEESQKNKDNVIKQVEGTVQNKFPAAVISSQLSMGVTGLPSEQTASSIQISSECQKNDSSKKYMPVEQSDWDKIEILPDTEESQKNKDNVMKQKDIESFVTYENKYTAVNPRRSSRKKELKKNEVNLNECDISNSENCLDFTADKNKKPNRSKQYWNNVKKMKKEFSSFNNKHKSKLNVSVEVCKKTNNMPISSVPCQKVLNVIDDNTPNDKLETEMNLETHTMTANIETGNVSVLKKTDKNLSSKKDLINENNSTKNQILTIKDKTCTFVNSHIDLSCKTNAKLEGNCASAVHKKSINVSNHGNQIAEGNITSVTCSCYKDVIEIGFIIGNTVNKVNIIKKENENDFYVVTTKSCLIQKAVGTDNVFTNKQDICNELIKVVHHTSANKSSSTQKNTESADTATANFDIAKSIEKELLHDIHSAKKQIPNTEALENLLDMDIVASGSEKGDHDELLKVTKHGPLEISICTTTDKKNKSQRHPEKRCREDSEDHKKEELPGKKMKLMQVENAEIENNTNNDVGSGNKFVNEKHDVIMSQSFENIDEDMKECRNTQITKMTNNVQNNKEHTVVNIQLESNFKSNFAPVEVDVAAKDNLHSENIFTILEKDIDTSDIMETGSIQNTNLETHIKSVAAQGTHNDFVASGEQSEKRDQVEYERLCNIHENHDSDKSISTQEHLSSTNREENQQQLKSPSSNDVISLSDSRLTGEANNNSKENDREEPIIETPNDINKFTDNIKYESTPNARKSLNFTKNVPDPDLTSCSSSAIAKNTQEKEFMRKAFEQTQRFHTKRPLETVTQDTKKKCITGSCLTPAQLLNIKELCRKYDWEYVNKYVDNLTHLVVSVDEDNKSQRSVKYMCALAAGKWIVSYEWVQQCISKNDYVAEEPFEVLDWAGEPGPRRSRLAKKKLFEGITFFCMPPCMQTLLDIDTLKSMLKSAGAVVVNDVRGLQMAGDKPGFLLAETEDSQDSKLTYLAMELGVVPLSVEWALNCLGSYTLSSAREQLLCPYQLVPATAAEWPLLANEFI